MKEEVAVTHTESQGKPTGYRLLPCVQTQIKTKVVVFLDSRLTNSFHIISKVILFITLSIKKKSMLWNRSYQEVGGAAGPQVLNTTVDVDGPPLLKESCTDKSFLLLICKNSGKALQKQNDAQHPTNTSPWRLSWCLCTVAAQYSELHISLTLSFSALFWAAWSQRMKQETGVVEMYDLQCVCVYVCVKLHWEEGGSDKHGGSIRGGETRRWRSRRQRSVAREI